MKYIVTLNGKNYEVEVENAQATLLSVTDVPAPPLAPVQSAAPAPAPAAAPAPAPQAQTQAAGEPVRAPMPGTIVSVKAVAGTAVKKGQVLMILEAMKMENEITAPRDGTVIQVLVTQGASVEANAVLAVLN